MSLFLGHCSHLNCNGHLQNSFAIFETFSSQKGIVCRVIKVYLGHPWGRDRPPKHIPTDWTVKDVLNQKYNFKRFGYYETIRKKMFNPRKYFQEKGFESQNKILESKIFQK